VENLHDDIDPLFQLHYLPLPMQLRPFSLTRP